MAGPPAAALAYRVEVYLPGERFLTAQLSWPEGRPRLEPEWDDPWAVSEVLKLARVLKRTEKSSVTRWRAQGIHKDDPIGSS